MSGINVSTNVNRTLDTVSGQNPFPLLDRKANSFQIAGNASINNPSVLYNGTEGRSELNLANVPPGQISKVINDTVNYVNKHKDVEKLIVDCKNAKLTQSDIKKLIGIASPKQLILLQPDLSGLDLRVLGKPHPALTVELVDANLKNTNMSGIDFQKNDIGITGRSLLQGANLSQAKIAGDENLQTIARTADKTTNMKGAKFIVDVTFHDTGAYSPLNPISAALAQPSPEIKSAMERLKNNTLNGRSIIFEYRASPGAARYY
jgi:hypothetical protein